VTSGRSDRFDEPDWAGLWRALVEEGGRYQRSFPDPARSERYLRRLSAGPKALEGADPLIDAVVDHLAPGDTVLDIGAGAGRWALRLARVASQVTAVEPEAALGRALSEHAAALGIANVTVVAARWDECDLEPHDAVLNSHAMYGTADLPRLVASMMQHARKRCYLTMRWVEPDGVMADLSRQVRGHPHDSPNFTIGYNVLLQLGLCPQVAVDSVVKHWRDPDLDSAVERAKRHLYLPPADAKHDDRIRHLLAEQLRSTSEGLVWPDGTRSVLCWWEVSPQLV
jgi:SAM-dependent methyltransferase